MTSDEAIKILVEHVYGDSVTRDQRFRGAMKLGIEALKRVQYYRGIDIALAEKLLPGETA